jgi:hypothetical protein
MGIVFEVAKNLPVLDGIEAVRGILGGAWFDKEKCAAGLDCLFGYKKEYDDAHGCFKRTPLHDWTSHGADAMRYAAIGFRSAAAPVAKPMRAASNYNPLEW